MEWCDSKSQGCTFHLWDFRRRVSTPLLLHSMGSPRGTDHGPGHTHEEPPPTRNVVLGPRGTPVQLTLSCPDPRGNHPTRRTLSSRRGTEERDLGKKVGPTRGKEGGREKVVSVRDEATDPGPEDLIQHGPLRGLVASQVGVPHTQVEGRPLGTRYRRASTLPL